MSNQLKRAPGEFSTQQMQTLVAVIGIISISICAISFGSWWLLMFLLVVALVVWLIGIFDVATDWADDTDRDYPPPKKEVPMR